MTEPHQPGLAIVNIMATNTFSQVFLSNVLISPRQNGNAGLKDRCIFNFMKSYSNFSKVVLWFYIPTNSSNWSLCQYLVLFSYEFWIQVLCQAYELWIICPRLGLPFHFPFLKDFIYFLVLEREKGGRKGEKYWSVVCSTPPTGDLARNPGLCTDQESNRWSFTLWDNAHPLSHTSQGPFPFLNGVY